MAESTIGSPVIGKNASIGPAMGIVGYGCSMSTVLIAAYSPLLATPEISSPVTHGITHALMFLAMACVYFALYRFIKNRDAFVCSKRMQIIAFALQLVLPVIGLVNNLCGFNVPVPITATAWICFGAASAFLICTWTAAQNAIEEDKIRSVNFFSFCIAACETVCVLCMPPTTGIAALLALCIVSFALLLCAPHRGGKTLDSDSAEWFEESRFSKRGSYMLFVNGIMLGAFAGLLVARESKGVLPAATTGLALILVAIIFYVLSKKAPSLLSLRQAHLAFLPFLICGIITIGFLDAPFNTIAAFVLFVILYLIDYSNASALSLRGKLLSISPCFCFSRGRMFIIAGQAVGWVIGAFLAGLARGGLPIVSFVLIGLACLYISATALNPQDHSALQDALQEEEPELMQETAIAVEEPKAEPQIEHEEPDEQRPVVRPYKNKCAHAAKRFDLTPREGEILVFLAKGRNAKYIADQLFVAERTVKTHTYHIYQKMGIHSQQELIDIVEGESDSEAVRSCEHRANRRGASALHLE